MTTGTDHIVNAGTATGATSVSSGVIAFAAHTLPVVQYASAIVAIVAGIFSIAWVIRRWNHKS